MPPSPGARIAGGLFGLLIGDALGVPYEFRAPQELPPSDQLEFTPPPDFERSHPSVRALEAGPSTEQSNGNGSLMRVLPLALWHVGHDRALAEDAMRQSRVTHGHRRSQVCCALYCLWARRTLEGSTDAWTAALADFRSLYREGTPEREELEGAIRPDSPDMGRGSGYVVDCLRSARDCMRAGDYERVVKAAVALGHDTDTTAAVAGGIAGLRDGLEALPSRWREALRGKELLEPLLGKLLARRRC
jgi:ADP-ribosyl-[dinitrogen reductase] hydrolase